MAQVILDMSALLKIERDLRPAVGEVLQKLAQDTELYIKSNWSSSSPSAPGEAPAVDTGNLTNSITADEVSPTEWHVNVGAEYGAALEYGTSKMAARPFVLPAVEQIAQNAPNEMVKAVD